MSVFADDMPCIQKIGRNPHTQKIFLELTNRYSKVTRYKINIQKLIIFPYTMNNPKIKLRIPFTINFILFAA